ncbi:MULTISPECIES: PLP-dependent cysteine synthase family protein [Vogesella]|uniref:Cystathionine beta-synthase n=1 Tax=Vogesella indigofera TaxID=45465 RepID=A0A495BHM4_VOGIN|nr:MULTISPECIES: cysteine synthase family protein [Vogesella]KMJ53802.1 cysteine synthase [Vogesella sp. EB]MDC7690618.1 cysteine synthase family protein [Vogesella indigofera]RKQ60849.1 cystathionine beta-synthase [Vogesella indigofera]
MILNKVTDLIGNTPVLSISIPAKHSKLLLKIEKNNPGGSIKDRMARNMVIAALKAGRLKPGGVVVESSSGNTGCGLAIAAIEFGLRFIAVVDHHAAQDKIAVMRALGAEIRYVEGNFREDEVAVVERQRLAAELASQIPGAVFMNQSDNAANAGGYSDFVREVIEEVGGVDAYVGCVGTGGSMTGIARGLKVHNPHTKTIAVEPAGSIVFGQPGHPYYQSGTGTPAGDTVGLVLDYSCIDLGVQVSDTQAFETARYIAQRTGLLVGGSTGGVIYKALEFIHSGLIGGNVVAAVADGGEKYLHTVYNESWLQERNLLDPQIWAQLDDWLSPDEIEDAQPTLLQRSAA